MTSTTKLRVSPSERALIELTRNGIDKPFILMVVHGESEEWVVSNGSPPMGVAPVTVGIGATFEEAWAARQEQVVNKAAQQ